MDQQQQVIDQIEVGILQSEIIRYENKINRHFLSLNKQGIWLFLATLGCWSVENGPYRYAAFWIAFILFFWLFFQERSIKGELVSTLDKLKTRIDNALPYGERRNELVAQVDLIKSRRLTRYKVTLQAGPFFLCWFFSCFSFLRIYGLY